MAGGLRQLCQPKIANRTFISRSEPLALITAVACAFRLTPLAGVVVFLVGGHRIIGRPLRRKRAESRREESAYDDRLARSGP